MEKEGFYIFLLLDVIGYTNIVIYRNDTCLIPDEKRNYEADGIDYKCFFAKDDYWLLRKTIRLLRKYDVSVRDKTGRFLKSNKFYTRDDALDGLMAVLPEDWRLTI